MAFSFGPSGYAGGAGGQTYGTDLEVIQTEGLGFLSLAGDAKVQLTPRWSTPPAPTASLMSIASRKGLVAAAGQEALYLATTESVRKAFEAPKSGDSEIRPFHPQVTVPLPTRISQLAFTADEKFLILSAESGGGLAVYDVQSLSQGSSQPAFELSTNGETLRQLVPNPMPELSAHCAIVTNNGNLLMANLEERKLVSGKDGPLLRTQVTCAAWSTKGKQLVAGRADGTVHQMTPDGTDKGQIPKPLNMGNFHVSSITWIENNVFLVIYAVTNGEDKPVYHIVTRNQQQGAGAPPPSFTFQKLTDPVEPWSEKVPHQTILRLHHFPPNLDDLLIVASTAVQDIGLLSRSRTPLASDKPVEKITNVFTTTELADDSRRAQLPMTEDLVETFPLGVALDLSSKEKVYKPIPADEIDQSPGPLPGLWVLSNEGVLCAWWVVYNESIRAGSIYPGLAAAEQSSGQQPSAPAFAAPKPFGSSTTSTPAFGAPLASTSTAFDASTTSTPAFGGPSALGGKPSPWATPASTTATPGFGSSSFGSGPAASAPKFGAPSFGSSPFGAKPAAPAFGQPSAVLGARPSPWATGSTSSATPAFGQSGFGSPSSANPSKVFGSSTPAASGGFSAFANKGGFASLAASTSNSGSIFGQPAGASTPSTKEISMDTDTAFPPPGSKPQSSPAFGSTFVLGTTFKADPKTASDNEPNQQGSEGSFFGGGFGLSLNDAAKSASTVETRDEAMDATTPAVEKPQSTFTSTTPAVERPTSMFTSTTPTTTPAPPKFGFPTTSSPSAGASIFGASKPAATPFANPFAPSKPAVNPFAPSKPAENPFAPSKQAKSESSDTESPEIKEEGEDKENLANIPEAPVPPDTISKAAYLFGGSSSSSSRSECSPVTVSKTLSKATDDAPLPPDFLAEPTSSKPVDAKEPEEAPLPPDFLSTKPNPKSKVPEEAPLPPDFLSKGPTESTPAVPAAPESPEEGGFSEEEEEEDDAVEEESAEEDAEEPDEDEEHDEEDEGEEGYEEGTEGSGIDVAKDLSPTGSGHTPGFTPQSSFTGMAGSTFSAFPKPGTEQVRPLFGEVSRNAPPLFPKAVPPSPRSPSPVRGAIPPNLLRPEASRSVSAPGMASQILGRKALPTQPQAHGQSPASFQKASKSSVMLDPNVELQRKMQAKREEEGALALRDPEDDGIQQILQAPVEPTLRMDEFVAVDSQLPELTSRKKEPVHIQCEALWRDINRVIDLIGLNSRALQAFIKGHSSLYKESGRTKEDLDNPDEWVLGEAEELGALVDGDLTRELEEGRVKNVGEIQAAIQDMLRDLSKLRAKQEDMRRTVLANVDPDQVSVARSLPLSTEQVTQQNELRKAYANVTRLLSEAEESLALLRAKIASTGGASRKSGAPTVEAVIRTINKLTTMAEKRSADIDVLETQMRKLRLSTPGFGSPAPGSREGSPFVGGTPHRRSLLMSPAAMRASVSSASASYAVSGTPPRKKMSMYTEEERKLLQSKQAKRKTRLNLLRESLERAGPQISTLQDGE